MVPTSKSLSVRTPGGRWATSGSDTSRCEHEHRPGGDVLRHCQLGILCFLSTCWGTECVEIVQHEGTTGTLARRQGGGKPRKRGRWKALAVATGALSIAARLEWARPARVRLRHACSRMTGSRAPVASGRARSRRTAAHRAQPTARVPSSCRTPAAATTPTAETPVQRTQPVRRAGDVARPQRGTWILVSSMSKCGGLSTAARAILLQSLAGPGWPPTPETRRFSAADVT